MNDPVTSSANSPENGSVNSPGEFQRGWRVLSASFVGIGVSMVSIPYYSSGIFVRPLEQEFGWSRGEIGLAGLVALIALTITAPIAGRVIDRFGIRSVATISLFLYSLGLLGLSMMNGSLLIYYAIIGGYTVVGVCSSPIGFTRAVTAWFVRHRGLALGISLTSTGLVAVLLPFFLTPFVAEHGWRAGYMLLFTIVIAAIPIVWLWIRDSPQSVPGKGMGTTTELKGIDARTVFASRRFWTLGVMFLLIALAVSGLIASFIPLLLDRGFSPEVTGYYGALLGASIIGGRLVTGFAIDRIFAPFVTAFIFTMVAIGCLALALGGDQFVFAAAIALGFAMGAEVDLLGYFTARYFGMKSYGVIYGSLYSMFGVGAGLSPAIAGMIYDASGSYQGALFGAACLLMVSVMLSLSLGSFPNKEEDSLPVFPGAPVTT